jgi:hypothetical protein
MKNFHTLIVAFICMLTIQDLKSQSYNFDGLSSGDVGNFTNGWLGSPTTNYSWRANAGTTISPGTGPTVDHTLGTAAGIYMYVEASLPAAVGDTASLISPNITLTGVPNPGLSFWYHMAGTAMGNMYIDVLSGGSWQLAIDSLIGSAQADPTDPWLNKVVNLGAYSGVVKVKFRAEFGTGWSGDIAIDDVSLVQMTPYDASLNKVIPSHYYYMMPQSQIQGMTFSGLVSNEGADTITNVTLNASINTTPLSGSIAQILPTNSDTITLTSSYTPSTIGQYIADFTVSIAETDTTLFNDSAQYKFEVSDTIYSRENDNVTLGIGFTGATGVFGQMFEIFNTDSLTSVSFKLVGPTINDDIKVKLYQWDAVTGLPGAIIDSSASFNIPADTAQWYTLQFPCDRVLTTGKYFFAIEQVATNNLSMGYTPEFYEPGVTWFNGGTGWTSFESSGFMVSLAIRPNFGVASWPTVSLGNDTGYCAGSAINLSAPSGFNSYLWSNGATTQIAAVSMADSNFWVQVTNNRGCAVRDTIIVSELSLPTVTLPAVVGICDNTSATLVANNDPTYIYLWSTSSTDSSIVVNTPGTYHVTVTSTDGCTQTGFTFVQQGITPVAQINGDTVQYCQGSSVQVTAQGTGNLYTWSNGTTGNPTTISQSGIFVVTVTSPQGCSDVDSAFAVENPAPPVLLSDTALAFCDGDFGSLHVNPINGASYLWSTGDTTSSISTNQAGAYWVQTTLNGCMGSDSGVAIIHQKPIVSLGSDTLICETSSITLDGGVGVSWLWSTGEITQMITVNSGGNYSVTITNTHGCSGSDTIAITTEICSGIDDLITGADVIQVYPNPAIDKVYLKVNPDWINSPLKVVDIKGAIVFQKTIKNLQEEIRVDHWGSGVYYIQIQKDGQSYMSSFIVR